MVSRSEGPERSGLAATTGELMRKADVAQLSSSELSEMSDSELVRVIRSVHQPHVGGDLRGPLQHRGRKPLAGLAWRARQRCRNQGY